MFVSNSSISHVSVDLPLLAPYLFNLCFFRRILAEAQQTPLQPAPAAALNDIDARLQQKRAQLQQQPAPSAPADLESARRAWLLAQEELRRLQRVQLPQADEDQLQAARRRLCQEVEAQLRALDAEETRIKMQSLLPSSVSVSAQAALDTLKQERALLEQQYQKNLETIHSVRETALKSAAERNAEAQQIISQAAAQTQQAVARVRALEDAYHDLRTRTEKARVQALDTPQMQTLQQARDDLQRLIEQRNSSFDDSLARHRWEVDETLRKQQFELDELARMEQFRLAEERRLSQYRLNNTKVEVSAEIPVQTVRMQPALAIREVTRMMPVQVQKQIPVQVPVALQDTLRVDSTEGSFSDKPFEPRLFTPAEFTTREYTPPARPAPLPLPVQREEQLAAPQSVEVALERTEFEEKVIPVTERLLKPVVVLQEQQVQRPLETIVRKEFVIPVRLADTSIAAIERVQTLPSEIRERETVDITHTNAQGQQQTTRVVDRGAAVTVEPHEKESGGIFGGLRRLFGGGSSVAASASDYVGFRFRF